MHRRLALLSSTILLFSACGGTNSDSTPSTASSMLQNKTFYAMGGFLGPTNYQYTKHDFTATNFVYATFDEDNTKVDSTLHKVTYEGLKIILDDELACDVAQKSSYIALSCGTASDIGNIGLYSTLEKAKDASGHFETDDNETNSSN